MTDQATHRMRPMPAFATPRTTDVFSPLPTDVMPNIMLRVENRDDFSRLARTCRGFYAWSAPWLKSRRQAAELNRDPQRLLKLPAWIKSNSQHLHPADCDAPQRWNNESEKRMLVDVLRRSVAFTDAALTVRFPASSATEFNAAHLDFVFFSPRLLPDVNEEAFETANERLVANASFALAGFGPSGEAWQCDVLAGALAWLAVNADRISIDARSRLLLDLRYAMQPILVAQRSPAMATDLLAHGLSKSYRVSDCHLSTEKKERWDNPLLTILVSATEGIKTEAGSAVACAFLCAIVQVVSGFARTEEREALTVLIGGLRGLMALMPEKIWTAGSAESAWLLALVQAVQDMPDALASIKEILIQTDFVNQDGWNALLLSILPTPSQAPG